MARTPLEASQQFFDEVLNGQKLDSIDDLVSADYVELRQALAAFNAAFPDNRWYIDERIVEGDKIVTRFHWTGTHTAEFNGVPATNKSASVKGVVIDEFEDGQMARSRILMDRFGLLQQLGLLPPTGG